MRYLGLALYAEGPTDYYFLRPLLQRLSEDLCAREAATPVEVSEVLALDHPREAKDDSRGKRILAAARTAEGTWQVLFLHADGAGDPRRAREEQVAPGIAMLRDAIGDAGQGVAVIPVRETETWAIADGDAVRLAFGTELSNSELGLPVGARAAATVTDPKAVLQSALQATQPSGRRRKQGVSPYLNALGEQVSIACLRELEAFAELERELRCALRHLGILH